MSGPFLAHRERFGVVGSTNDVVRDWLAHGTPEVCLATADEQTRGRGREGRTWTAPAGTGLLLSLGFRPIWLAPERTWRIAATLSLAMAEAAEVVAGLSDGTVRLKWPNDLVIERSQTWLKLGGVLGETNGLGTADPRVIVGMGVNVDWVASEFPADIAPGMTSLREASRNRHVGPEDLLDAFLPRLHVRIDALREDEFDERAWRARQATTNRRIRLELPNGRAQEVVATGVDAESGALIVEDGNGTRERRVLSGEVRHLRAAATPVAARV